MKKIQNFFLTFYSFYDISSWFGRKKFFGPNWPCPRPWPKIFRVKFNIILRNISSIQNKSRITKSQLKYDLRIHFGVLFLDFEAWGSKLFKIFKDFRAIFHSWGPLFTLSIMSIYISPYQAKRTCKYPLKGLIYKIVAFKIFNIFCCHEVIFCSSGPIF